MVAGFGARLKSALSPSGILAGAGLAIGTAQVIDFFGDAIDAASDLNETTTKTAQIFGDEALPALEKWADTAATAFGQSKQQALDGASSFAIFGKSAGLAGDELIGFSTELTELASDFASFFNTSPEDALIAIQAALRGESEPIRRYGVLLDDATLRQRAFKLGLISTTKDALTPQQRVLAAQAEILAQTSDAQGDFARTSEGLANQQRIQAAKLQDAMARLGDALLPVALGFTEFAADTLPKVIDGVKGVLDVLLPLGGLLAEHADEIIPALAVVMGVKLVAALKTARAEAILTGKAFGGLKLAALLAIPVVEDLSHAAAEAVSDDTVDGVQKVSDSLGLLGTITGDTAYALFQLKAIAASTGQPMDELAAKFVELHDSGLDTSTAIDQIRASATATAQELSQRMAAGLEETRRGFLDARREWSTAILQGRPGVAGAAGDVAGEVPEAWKQARREAKEIAAALPSDIADAILSGKDDLKPIRKLMRDIIAGSVSDAATLAQDAALLVNPKIAEALTGNSTESKDAMLNQVVEPLIDSILTLEPTALEAGADIPKGLKQAIDRNGPLAVQALRDLMGDQNATLAQLAVFARERGLDGVAALIQGMLAKKRDAKAAGRDVGNAAVDGLDIMSYAYRYGYRAGTSWSDGISDGLVANFWKFAGKLDLYEARLRAEGSPPYTHSREWGEGVGESYIDALTGSLGSGMARIASLLRGALNPSLVTPASAAGAAAQVAGGSTFNVTTGSIPKEKTTLEIAHELRRAEYLGVLPK